MAKSSAKPQPGKPPSKHSRAARRATSPSIDTDKSLKRANPPSDTKPLSLHHGAGITKRKAKSKTLSRTQRVRHEKGLARAEAVLEQLEVKVGKSRQREKVARGRRTTWEDINEYAGDRARGRKKFDTLMAHGDGGDAENIAMGEMETVTESEGKAEVKTEVEKDAEPKEEARVSPDVKKEEVKDEVEVW